ncbi:MAG: hypothetical protein QM783_20025 [Phycisphaerales bacterium]
MDGLKARKIAVWCVAAAGACVPGVMFWVSLSAAQQSRPLKDEWPRAVHVLNAPGIWLGTMTRSWVVQVIVSGLFWGVLVGAAAAAALVNWRDRGPVMRGLTVGGGVRAVRRVAVVELSGVERGLKIVWSFALRSESARRGHAY